MQIKIDESAGFCWGVVRTIETVEDALAKAGKKQIYILGEIIHNPAEIVRLEQKGLKTIQTKDLSTIDKKNSVVIIRAHGEPPETYEKVRDMNLILIDATCPLVKNLQDRVRKRYEAGFKILIFGKYDHAEVIGIRGVCRDECTVVQNVEEALSAADFEQKTALFSQTTMEKSAFAKIAEALKEKLNAVSSEKPELKDNLEVMDTICRFVSGREELLANFVASNELILFVAGRKSSNGKSLFNFCKSINEETYFIESPEEIDYTKLEGKSSIGITGATSTPQWYLSLVKETIEARIKYSSEKA